MRYRLRPGYSLDSELRNLFRALNENLALALLMACRNPELGVHEARRSCKEIRALLRLLGADSSSQRFYRSLAGGLSGSRDAVVMQAAWQDIRAEIADFQAPGFAPVSGFLGRTDEPEEVSKDPRVMFLELAQDVEAQSVLAPPCDFPEDSAALEHRVERIYRRARKAWRKASGSGGRDDFHAFRKRSKDLYYSLRFLRPLLPKPARRQVRLLKALTEVQGLANDVAVLDDHLLAHADQVRLTQVSRRRLQDELADKEAALQREAYRLAKPILAPTPRQFIRSLKLSAQS